MISIEYMSEFVILAETLNYARAAEKAFITQPALSRHIISLEESLGVRLFDRTTRVVSLTEAGQYTYEAFTEILSQFDSLRAHLEAAISGSRPRLRLCCPNYWIGDYIEPVISSREMSAAPYEICLEVHQPIDSLSRVQRREGDAFFGLGMPVNLSADMEMRHITNEPACVLLTANDPRSQRQSLKLADLKNDTLVLIDEGNGGYDAMNEAILDLLKENEIQLKDVKYANQVETLGIAIFENDGISIMPTALRHMKRSYLRAIPLDDDFRFPLCLYFRRDSDNPFIEDLIDSITRYAASPI